MLPDQKEPAGAAVRSETEEENVTGENRSVEPAESGPDLSRTPGGALTGRQIGRYLIGGRLGRGGT